MNISGLDFLVLVLQSSNSFDLNDIFQVLFSLSFTVNEGHIKMLFLGAVCSTGLFSLGYFFHFISFSLKSSNCFPLKSLFSGGPSFFVPFVCNDVALYLRLHVVALPTSLTFSGPAKTAKKLTIRTWLLNSCPAKFQYFWYEGLLSSFV